MNNRYLFRGKRVDNGEWVEGYYAILDEVPYIIFGYSDTFQVTPAHSHLRYRDYPRREIIPKTVGQWTGLTDKNGVRIFEGDIIKYNYNTGSWFGGTHMRHEKICPIVWCPDSCSFRIAIPGGFQKLLEHNRSQIEVIGNIHDNTEEL